MPNQWEWSISPFQAQHADRLALLREVHFETSRTIELDEHESVAAPAEDPKRGKALSLNMSPGGMLVLMDWTPREDQVLRIQVPVATEQLRAPTLAEVRWTRQVPFPGHEHLCLVGLKFLV